MTCPVCGLSIESDETGYDVDEECPECKMPQETDVEQMKLRLEIPLETADFNLFRFRKQIELVFAMFGIKWQDVIWRIH